MHTFSDFEIIITKVVWKQQPASTLNYLCTAPNCYSTCDVDRSVGSVLSLFPWQFSSCPKCNHPHWCHYHLRSTWAQVEEAQATVDDNMKKQWEGAKDEKAKTAALVATSKRALEDLNRVTDDALDELAGWATEYARLSLSGSFSAPLEKAIRLLEQRCRGMEEKGVSLEQLAKVRKSLEQMKERLDLLGKAKEKVREGARKFEGKVREGVRKGKEVKGQVGARKPEELPTGARKDEGGQKGEGEIQEGAQKVGGGVWERVREKVRQRTRARARERAKAARK